MICPIKMTNPKENKNMGCLEKNCAWFVESIQGIEFNMCSLKVIALAIEKQKIKGGDKKC